MKLSIKLSRAQVQKLEMENALLRDLLARALAKIGAHDRPEGKPEIDASILAEMDTESLWASVKSSLWDDAWESVRDSVDDLDMDSQ